MFHIQSKMIFIKKGMAHDNSFIPIRIRDKKTSFNIHIMLKEAKNGGKNATRKEKEKEHLYLPCLDFLPIKNHNMSSQK